MQKDESSRSERVGLLFHYLRATDFPKIARRYFALNLYDGVLTMMGFILGYYMVGGRNPEEIVGAGIAASIAMGLSGFVGAFITELAERGKELEELEKTMFKDLGNTIVSETHKIAAFFIALIDGAAPAIGALLLSTPLMRPFIDYLEYDIAIKLSMGLSLIHI